MKNIFILFPVCCFLSLICYVGYGQERKVNTDYIKHKWLDLPYSNVSNSQKLDIYLPNDGEGPFPVIVSIHGGAFMMGDKADSQVIPMLEGLKRGYAVVSVNYRLSGEALFPKNIHDIKTAIRWIKANSVSYKLNQTRIAVWGGSAGGNLSALAGTSADVRELEDLSSGNPEVSSEVQAVVDWFGPINFSKMDEQFIKSGKGKSDHGLDNSPESRVLGRKISEIPELVKAANPATYITKNDPPFFIEHGKEDQLVPAEQSVSFAYDLEKILGKEKVTFILLENTYHGGPQFETVENLNKVFKFLDQYLK